ncbi:MAG TPA: hypothetical protein VFA05_07900 [Gaiellaceae bacterium]|nr:hypothetical protein [Gaiellaceae bacterium]
MGGTALPLRRLASTAAVAALGVTAATAHAAPTSATAAPTVHRGQAATISVATRSHAVCAASVQYADGVGQDTGVKRPRGGRVAWVVRIPTNAALGVAHWRVVCGGAFRRSGTWVVTVVGSGGGRNGLPLPRVVVDRYGFSERPSQVGSGANVSYGLFLRNTSQNEDALNVYVLINFVTASGALNATVTKNVDLVQANSVWALGDSIGLRANVPIVKLEITVKVGSAQKAQSYALPHFANVSILPESYDPGYVGEVDGEIVNDSSPQTLDSANLSVVLLDASGNIVGGGTAMIFSPLPSGSRMVFLAQQGFNSVPLEKAASAVISVAPKYANS